MKSGASWCVARGTVTIAGIEAEGIEAKRIMIERMGYDRYLRQVRSLLKINHKYH